MRDQTATPEREREYVTNVAIPRSILPDLRRLADANERSLAAELRLAVRRHVARESARLDGVGVE